MRSVLLAVLLMLSSAVAEAASDADRAAMQGAIERQFEAFRRDDGEAAFAFATPSLRTMFGSEANFMAMVKQGYPPVYRPKGWAMRSFRDEGGAIEQSVDITDESGQLWTAIYGFEQQPDGRWLISSCRLVKAEGQTA